MKFDPDPEGIDANVLAYWFDLEEAARMALDGRIAEPLSALQILRAAS